MSRYQARFAQILAQKISADLRNALAPPSEITASAEQPILPHALLKKCNRNYIIKVVYQINRTYKETCYDACAVMIRRLVETLIIETYEHHKIADRIQENGEFYPLDKLIGAFLTEPTWNLTRNSKQGLKAIRDLKTQGDLSAHSRRYNAHREDIDRLRDSVRIVTQELLSLAGLS
ncbi:MAG: DUF4145 domain-containing protein [Chloroflexota bacterium]|nr:DUF4145 domain-containing protein [Chloroflexota bacterium]